MSFTAVASHSSHRGVLTPLRTIKIWMDVTHGGSLADELLKFRLRASIDGSVMVRDEMYLVARVLKIPV